MYEQVEEIIWLEDPSKWPYVKEDRIKSIYPKSIIRDHGWKVLGYENVRKVKGSKFYSRRVWYLDKQDFGGPKYNGVYSEFNLPVKGVKTSEIKIPRRVRIIRAYKIPKLVPEYFQVEKLNGYWGRANYERVPFIGIHRYGQYGVLEYDMITTDYKLKEEACNEINFRCREFIKQINEPCQKFVFPVNDRLWTLISPNSGRLPKIRIFECRLLTSQIVPIIKNKENWKKIYSSKIP